MSNRHPQRFAEEGYCLFPKVFTDEEVASNLGLLDEAVDSGLLLQPNYLLEPHTLDDRWLQICRHPPLLDALQAVLGRNLILVYSSVFIKPPHSEDTVGWHQDNTYWPSVHGTDVATVWLAFDDTNEENAAMQVIPGSHAGFNKYETILAEKHATLDRKIVITPEMEARAITLEMPAGALSIHDSFLLHSSRSNRSERRRAGYTIRYCNTDSAWVDVEQHPISVYLVRGEPGLKGKQYIDVRTV